MKENETEKGKEKEEEEELEDGYTLDNDPSAAQCSRPRKSTGRNHEKWQRYKEIFSLYYAEQGDLKIPRSYVQLRVTVITIWIKVIASCPCLFVRYIRCLLRDALRTSMFR